MENFKISKTDYLKQKEMLESYVGKVINYDNKKYLLIEINGNKIEGKSDNGDVNLSYWYVCILFDIVEHKFISVNIYDVFKCCYPLFC